MYPSRADAGLTLRRGGAANNSGERLLMPKQIIRSMLSVPGIRERFIEKARAVPADVICFDLEDSVAMDEKPAAREIVARELPLFEKNGRLLVVRVNGLDTGLAEQDLEAVVCPQLDGINMPKCHDASVVRQLDTYLTFLEKTRGIPDGQIAIIPWIETPHGVANAYEVCLASERLIGAAMGGEDYATSMGVQRTAEGSELLMARLTIANACAAADIVAIDTPTAEFKDAERLRRDLETAKGMGYRGKFCIHPTQVEVANNVFAPSADDLDWANRVVEAYEEGKRQGLGAVALDGAMIDDPVADRAYNILEWTRQIEQREAVLKS